jgi:hypothetical protein
LDKVNNALHLVSRYQLGSFTVKLLHNVHASDSDQKFKVALVIPPTLEMGKMWCPNLPIGLAYLAAAVEKGGYDLTLIDCQALQLDQKC